MANIRELLSGKQFLKSTIELGKIYYFQSDKISKESHYHVIIGLDDGEYLILGCFTTQKDNRIKYIDWNNLDYSTLVCIKPSQSNGLKRDCFICCNSVQQWTLEELETIYDTKGIAVKGILEENYLEQIAQGVNDSRVAKPICKELVNKCRKN